MPLEFHCTRCQNPSHLRTSLSDPAKGGRLVTLYECPECGKVDSFVDD